MVTQDDLGEGPSVLQHTHSSAGTLSSGGLPFPPDPLEDPCGPAALVPFPSNKPLDTPPEPPININPRLGSRVESSMSPSPSRKSKGSGIPRKYLIDLVQRCGALLAIEEFAQEAVILNIEALHEEEGLDDGFGVYEIITEEDPVNEEDGEIEDTAEMYASGMRRFDERTSAVDEPTKEDGTFPEDAEAEDRRAIRRAALRYTIVGELELLDERRLAAADHVLSYQNRISRSFQKKVIEHKLHECDMVLKSKLQVNWEGPYIVKEVYPRNAYKLVNADGEELSHQWNGLYLKRFYP
ncbi:hypothetical protein Taro_040546 [Colocasia esculenta]|uniref:Uncharacterized protein n=1 Tax=Colocasia esculenta TaxID=4460 RepID=A0A843WTC7_COLES|nr:hypothetical protein [Colocasia esculenta]